MSVSLLALLAVLIALGTHRVTRLITRDRFPPLCVPREAFVQRWGAYEDTVRQPVAVAGRLRRTRRAGHWLFGAEFTSVDERHRTSMFMKSLAYLWECDWCASTWVGAGLTYLTWRWHETLLWVLLALTASTVTGLLAQREPSDEEPNGDKSA